MNGGRVGFVLGLVCLLAGPVRAVGQPSPAPVARPQTAPAMTPVPPDTVTVVVAMPDSLPQPLAVHVVQDTLEFGGPLHLVLDFGPDQTDDTGLQPQTTGDWLEPMAAPRPGLIGRLLGRGTGPAVDTSGLAPAPGLRVVRSFRVYRRNPLRIRWGDYLSPVLTVRGQAAGADQMAAIREPRHLGWVPWSLLLLAVALLIMIGLARWLWLRRNAPPPLSHWEVSAPAWLAFAVDLQDLLSGGRLSRGETRLFMDRLAAVARSYVAGRYRVAARESTGREIVEACRALGYRTAHPAGFGNLLDLMDRKRYDQTAPDPAFCREQAVQLLGRVKRVRLDVRYVPVGADDLLAAEKAWAHLVAELGTGAGRPAVVAEPEER